MNTIPKYFFLKKKLKLCFTANIFSCFVSFDLFCDESVGWCCVYRQAKPREWKVKVKVSRERHSQFEMLGKFNMNIDIHVCMYMSACIDMY